MQSVVSSKLVKGGEAVAAVLVGFGAVELKRPATATTYPQRDGGKSTTAAVADVPLPGVGLTLECRIYGRLDPKGQITFEPALPKGVGSAEDARMKFRAHVNAAVRSWAGWNRAANEAAARLMAVPGTAADGIEADAAPIVWTPLKVEAAPPTA